MAYSYTTYTGDGSNRSFSIPFPYIAAADIYVEVDGVPVTFIFTSSATVQTTVAPANGTVVTVRRKTARATPIVDFADGATLTEANLDDSAKQNLYSLQELDDNVSDEIDRSRTQVGTLPAVGGGDNNDFLCVNAGAWAARTASQARTHMGLGTAATVNTGTANGQIPVLTSTGLPAVSGVNLTNVVHARKYVRITERQTSGTSGGTYTTGATWQKRLLNNVEVDEVGGISLSSNAFSLAAGTYYIRIQTSALYVERCVARLRNTTDSTDAVKSQSGHAAVGTNNTVMLGGVGQITIAGTKSFQLELQGSLASADANALGVAHNIAAFGDNVYSIVEIWKLE